MAGMISTSTVSESSPSIRNVNGFAQRELSHAAVPKCRATSGRCMWRKGKFEARRGEM
jgi:hypothetical protein